jgi:hypothetical protein
MDLVTEVATACAPNWKDGRAHWRDVESYDLAVGPRTGGRLFPKTDERPDKPRREGQISRTECATIVFGQADDEEDDVAVGHEPDLNMFLAKSAEDLSEVYGSGCYLAVYNGGAIKTKAYGRFELHTDVDGPEWYDLLPKYAGLRKLIAVTSGRCVEHRRERKRYSRRGHTKHRTKQRFKGCDIFV